MEESYNYKKLKKNENQEVPMNSKWMNCFLESLLKNVKEEHRDFLRNRVINLVNK
jgi:hypothetical protein